MGLIAQNKRALYDYDIAETYRAGIVLHGSEVKSAKSGNVSLGGSYIRIHNNEAWLINAHIGNYKPAPPHDEKRTRKLLLKAKELDTLQQATKQGLQIIPLRMRVMRGLVKIDIGLGRARRKKDKRHYIKARSDHREARQSIQKS